MADKQTILIVDDDPNLAGMLDEYFHAQGYQVLKADWGAKAVEACQQTIPDIALLDIRLPDIDGYEVARRLHAQRRTQNVPFIFLTQRKDRRDRLQGLEMGAVDYITKPFDLEELRIRVRNAISRAKLNSLVNPVTGLPEGSVVDERLRILLKSPTWAVLSISVRGLEEFRESYGFLAADDVLRVTGLVLNETLRQVGSHSDMVGHLTTESFVVVTIPQRLHVLRERLKTRLGHSLDFFYPLKARLESDLPHDHLLHRISEITAPGKSFDDLDEFKTAILRSYVK